MTGIQGLIRAYALADPAIREKIGERWYPIKAPQGAVYPLVTMQLVVGNQGHHLRGTSGFEKPLYQIDVWNREKAGVPAFENVDILEGRIRARLGAFIGVLSDAESPETAYHVTSLFQSVQEFFEPDVNGGYYRKLGEYVIWHRPV